MSKLFEALRLRDLTLANRIMVSPMCQYSAVDGSGSDWHYAHLGALAGSGAALVCLEATHVSAVGRITPGCLGLYSDANEAALAPIVRMIRSVSPIKVGVQLAHAGRKGSSRPPWEGGKLLPLENGGWTHEAPSALPHAEGERPPHALTREQVAGVRDAFVASTRRAARLGFDAVELHFAHGYLIHQFLSPVSNQRDDEYGGGFANRVRFPLEVFDAVRAVFPQHLPVGVRVSATDWLDDQPSWDLAQTIELAQLLKARGCDWIDVSSGGISPQQKIVLGPGYQVPFARAVRAATGLPTVAVGLITEPQQAEDIVAGGSADMVALARAMLYDPRWAWHAAAALGGTVAGPKQYWRSLPRAASRIFGDISFGQR
jgi:2,4-dienoyl-CoA reductase-like NADH-dependent reductase (Old Yellow Enzyme family)